MSITLSNKIHKKKLSGFSLSLSLSLSLNRRQEAEVRGRRGHRGQTKSSSCWCVQGHPSSPGWQRSCSQVELDSILSQPSNHIGYGCRPFHPKKKVNNAHGTDEHSHQSATGDSRFPSVRGTTQGNKPCAGEAGERSVRYE